MADRTPLAVVPLRGAGGEPVDFRMTLRAHGLGYLPPNTIDDGATSLATALDLGGRVYALKIVEQSPGEAAIFVRGRRPTAGALASIVACVRTIFALDDDLSPLYARVADDPDLRWIRSGAGRLLRSPTAFEDVVRTICTTNCAWSATERMIGALVTHLGAEGVAFPSARSVATAGEAFFRDRARAGYRGAYLRSLGCMAASGEIDLEAWRAAPASELPDGELEKRLLALPGVGPYAAAHVMMLFGRHSRLVLDSWTRPTYARLLGRKAVSDRTIERRFARYGPFAGLAFWMTLWRGRLASTEEADAPAP
jgi:3-methyladenine DNA glycosylase/8-oxoguanine DNA glycosylase